MMKPKTESLDDILVGEYTKIPNYEFLMFQHTVLGRIYVTLQDGTNLKLSRLENDKIASKWITVLDVSRDLNDLEKSIKNCFYTLYRKGNEAYIVCQNPHEAKSTVYTINKEFCYFYEDNEDSKFIKETARVDKFKIKRVKNNEWTLSVMPLDLDAYIFICDESGFPRTWKSKNEIYEVLNKYHRNELDLMSNNECVDAPFYILVECDEIEIDIRQLPIKL